MSVRIYVGNLSKDLERSELESLFSEHADEIVSVKLISDRKTGKCRGFGFVTVKTDEQADAIVEKFNGQTFQDNPLKVEKALPRSKSKGNEESSNADNNAGRRKSKAATNRSSKGNSTEAESAQPDPRWAQDLAKLKELLSKQTTPSS